MSNRRIRTLAAAACLALPLAACSGGASGDEVAWAGAMCTATANAYLSSTLVANDTPPPEKVTDDSLPLYQARLLTEVSQLSTAVQAVTEQLGTVPSSLADATASLSQPVADLSATFTASGGPMSALAGAPDAAAAEAAMPPAAKASRETQASAIALAQAVLALGSTTPAFTDAESCRLPSPTPVPAA
jgi:hypothetical protein